jgi:hypothetical protein
MITLLSAPLPQAYSLLSPSLPEVAALALELLITTVLALIVAMAGTVNTVSSSARKQQYLTLTSNVNRVPETPAYRLAMPLNIQKDNPVASYLAETPANRLAMPFTHRHAASPSLDARTSRPWDGRSSRKGSWFTLAAAVLPCIEQNSTAPDSLNY